MNKRQTSTVKRMIPVNQYDIQGMESWLSDLAAEGLFLEKFGRFRARFRRETPRKAIYRVEPVSGQEDRPDPERQQAYAADGWTYVASLNRNLQIWRNDREEPQELHTDPVAQSYTYEALGRRLWGLGLVVAVLVLAILVMIGCVYFLREEPLLALVLDQNTAAMGVIALLELAVAVFTLSDALHIRKLQKSLRSGLPLSHKPKDYRGSRRRILCGYALLLVMAAVCYGTQAYGILARWGIEVAEFRDPLPVVSLARLEDDLAFVIRRADASFEKDYLNWVSREWSPLAPVQLEITQSGQVPGKDWPDGSGPYTPSLRACYYELAFQNLADPFLEGLAHREARWDPERKFLEIPSEDFDRVLLETEEDSQILLLLRGRQMLLVRYYGTQDLALHLENFSETLAAVPDGGYRGKP